MGIMRLFAKNPFDAPSVWRMVSWSPCTWLLQSLLST
jgi:hypothetical protein